MDNNPLSSAVIDWFNEQTQSTWDAHGPLSSNSSEMTLLCKDAWMLSAEVIRVRWGLRPDAIIGMGRIQHIIGGLGYFMINNDRQSQPIIEFHIGKDVLWGEINVARMVYEKKVADTRHSLAMVQDGSAGVLAYMHPDRRKHLLEPWWKDVDALRPNAKLAAVKLIKEKANLGLKDSKELFDEYDRACTAFANNAPKPVSFPTIGILSPQQQELLSHVSAGNHQYYMQPWWPTVEGYLNPGLGQGTQLLQAVKYFKEQTGMGLKESKDVCDEYREAYRRYMQSHTLLPSRS